MPTLTRPHKLEVQYQLAEVLREITPTDGYVYDFSGAEGSADNKVFRGRALFGEGDPVPMISILENPIPVDQLGGPEGSALSTGNYELVVQGFLEDDKENPTDPAHVAMADVKRRLALESKKAHWRAPEDGIFGLGRLVMSLDIGAGVVRPPDAISAKAYFWLLVTFQIAEDMSDPYEV